jgi:hypothetical protein
LPNLSALICTWISGSSLKTIGTDIHDTITRRTWAKLIHLRKIIAKIKKPKIGDVKGPKYNRFLKSIYDCNDHDSWLKNINNRVSGLEYLYQSKVRQNLIPESLSFLSEIDSQTGLKFFQSMKYRLNACLCKLNAIKRDDEDTQDMCLFIGDPSLDNIIWDSKTSQGTFVDLENSGWTDPAYIIAELLTNNIWFDKYYLKNNESDSSDDRNNTTTNIQFPFSKQFELKIIEMFVKDYEWSKSTNKLNTTKNATNHDDDAQITGLVPGLPLEDNLLKFNEFLERVELNKEFCAIKQLFFHVRGCLHELGNVINGFRVYFDSCGSGSGSGGGGTLAGNHNRSPCNIIGKRMGEKKPKGRSTSSLFGHRILFRGTHINGIHTYMKILKVCNYTRRCVGEYLTIHRIIDEVRQKEKLFNEIEREKEKKRLRIQCGMEKTEEGGW